MSIFHLKAPKENTQILAEAFDFNVPMLVSNQTNNYRSFKNNQNISNSQATITMIPLLKYMEARLPLKLRLKVKAHRTLLPSTEGNPAQVGTAPSVLSIDTFTVAPGSVNNLINKVSLVGEETYNYEQNDSVLRQVQTLINLLQYDQEKLDREHGLHVAKDIDNFIDYKTAIGSGNLTDATMAVQTAVNITAMNNYGFKSVMYSNYKWLLDRNSKYCILDKKEQNNLSNYKDVNGAVIAGLTMNKNAGVCGYGELEGVNGNTVYQTAYIDIYEDLMAPFLSTCYADDEAMIKTIATGSKIECAFNFDTNYLKSIVKCASEITIDSIDIDAIEIHNIHLFTSQSYKQEVENRAKFKAQSLSFSYLPQIVPNTSPQNIEVINSNVTTPTTTNVAFVQTNLNRIEKYYVLACPCDATKNNNNQTANQVKNLLYADIDNITLTVTAKGTAYPIREYTRRELEEMTAEVIGKKEWLDYISKDEYKTEYSINTLKSGPTNVGNYNAINYTPVVKTILALDGTGRTALRRQRLPFYIIDMSKLSLGEIDHVPISPCITYNENITLEFGYSYTNGFDIVQEPQMMYGYSAGQTYQTIPLCLPISLQLGRVNSSRSFELVPYTVSVADYANQYVKMLEDHSITVKNNHSQFGAGFFSDLWSGIKSVANTVAPIAEAVVPVADKIFGGKSGKTIDYSKYKRIL